MNRNIRERLVAHLLGEASAEESAAIERELAEDGEAGAALRAERDRLEATIGLVRDYGQATRSLSDERRADLDAQVGLPLPTATVIPFRRRRMLAAAAAVLLATGASAIVWFGAGSKGDSVRVLDEVARAPAERGSGSPAPGVEPPAPAHRLETATKTAADDRDKFLPEAAGLGERGSADFFLGVEPDPSLTAASGGDARPTDALEPNPRTLLTGVGYIDGALRALEPDAQAGSITHVPPLPETGRGAAPPAPNSPPVSRTDEWGSVEIAKGELRLGRVEDPSQGPAGEGRRRVLVDSDQRAALEQLGYIEEPRANSRVRERELSDRSRSWVSDFDAMQQFERDLLAKQGLEPNERGLRKLLEGLGHVTPGSSEPLDSAALLDVRWRLFGRAVLEERLNRVLDDCNRRPAESLSDMFFRHWGTRPFERTAIDAVSTFAADVDTSSYTLARKMLDAGVLPGADQIRVEEWINYFDADLVRPSTETFAITGELAPSPFQSDRLGEPSWLLRVGLQGREVEDYERSGLALTFVVDTSGSMGRGGRLDLVKNAMLQLLTKLDSRDSLSIVSFDNAARVVLEPTSATQRGRIEAAILSLGAAGGTNIEAGLVTAYELAARGYDDESQNRVVLLSDGVGNIGETDQARILERVAESRTNQIYLNTIGVGLGNHNDTFLEQLANRGDGVADYVDTPLAARRAFVERFTGTFQTIARDVKIQVEFDPARVREYRLIGYENRAIADRSFRDDTVDGGEVGAGHSVVALYELRGIDFSSFEAAPLATVRVRYLPPTSGSTQPSAVELTETVDGSDVHSTLDSAPIGLRKNVAVARVAEIMKRSVHARGTSLTELAAAVEQLANQSSEEEFRAFAGLFARNRAAIAALVKPPSPLEERLDELRYVRYAVEVEQSAPGTPDQVKLDQLTARIKELEEEVRRLVFDQVASDLPLRPGAVGEER